MMTQADQLPKAHYCDVNCPDAALPTRAKVVVDDNPQLLTGSQPWALQGVPDSSTVMDSSTVICGLA